MGKIFEQKITEYENKIKELKDTKKRLNERLQHWVNPKDAKDIKFAICPQIERSDDVARQKKGG